MASTAPAAPLKGLLGRSSYVRVAEVLTILWVCVVAGAYLIPASIPSFSYHARTFNEGWNVVKAEAVAAGEQLYPSDPGVTPTNYFPVSFHLIAALKPLFGNALFAGRTVAGVSLVIVAMLAGLFAYRISSDRWSAAVGTVLVLLAIARYAPEYVALNDPQMFGHALVLLGVWIGYTGSVRLTTIGGGVVGLGLMTKYNVIAFPAGLVVWLCLRRDMRRASAFLSGGALVIALVSVAALTSDGPGMFRQVLEPRAFRLKQSVQQFIEYATVLYPVFVASLAVVIWFWRDVRFRVLSLAFAFSFVVAAVFGGGVGVGRNAYFDLLVSSVALAAAGLGAIRSWSPVAACAAGVILCGNLALERIPTIPRAIRDSRVALSAEPNLHREAVNLVRNQPGPAICDDPLVCFDAGKPLTYDQYATPRVLARNRMIEQEFISRIRAGEFGAIQLHDSGRNLLPGESRFTVSQQFEQAMLSAYAPAGTFGTRAVFVRKPFPN